MKKSLKTHDLAKEIGLSTQTVRNYEQCGFIPQAERGDNGYRLYSRKHLHAIRTAQVMIKAYGWMNTQRIMQSIHQDDSASALAIIDACHASIHQRRCEVEETLNILRATSIAMSIQVKEQERAKQHKLLSIRQAAQRVNVQVSALRFWEERGLLHPVRNPNNGYRLYDEEQMRALEVVALLRKTSYGFEAIQRVLEQLVTGTPEEALLAAENRLKELSEESRRCFEATALLYNYINSH